MLQVDQEIAREIVWELFRSALHPLRKLISLPSPPDHNLGGERPRLVGRSRELGWLRARVFHARDPSLVAIVGIGGVGKTALARAIAFEALDRARSRRARLKAGLPFGPRLLLFNAIIWISARGEELGPRGIVRSTARRTLNQITAEIARVLRDQELLHMPPKQRAEEVCDRLSRRCALLIVDGLEEADPAVMDFLRNLPHPTRVILTARVRPDDFPTLELRPLAQESARRLAEQEAEKRGIPLSREEIEELIQQTEGLPLAIVLSVARLSRGITWQTVLRELQAARGDLGEYMVGQQVDEIRKDSAAWRLFLALGLFDPEAGADRAALGEVAGLPDRERDEGLMRLIEWALVEWERERDRFRFLHSLIHARALNELQKNPDMARELQARRVDWCRRILSRRPYEADRMRIERPNIELVLGYLKAEGRIEELADLLRHAKILIDEGQEEVHMRFVRAVFQFCVERNNGAPLRDLVWRTVERLSRPQKKAFEREWKSRLWPLLEPWEQAFVEVWLMEASRDEFTQKALEAIRAIEHPEALLRIYNMLAFRWMEPRPGPPDYEQTRKWLEKGLSLLKEQWDRFQDPQEWEAILRGNYALYLARAERRYEEAIRILEEIRPGLRWKRDLAEWYAVMAFYEFRRCRVGKAWQYGQEADQLMRELGLEYMDTVEGREWERLRQRLARRHRRWVERIRCGLRRISGALR